ncbi:DegT/DnrJ/EryC1/StrS family aminotransferase [Paracraurococcus lichenis]|uniref:DegT/DnrJ/EryC1/StrS family aminotransferase n=1 Tax=Paracraurococcus lichenis TaxID=3064888 RepID=A0ABT9DZ59_9PROT|nr:DegT/DnrJ/EryC1/StrS family aminotransferase [Paracraurococcus sp. LOR1-02]MDO9709192.1 DegT/DnrJ/EryC1/StrS family aminotransferase [Paracraurococcus sp. LOR1-02]
MPLGKAAPRPGPVLPFPRPPRPEPAADEAGERILLSPPELTGQELAALEATLASGWVAPAGPVPAAFEQAVAAATGFPHVLATASGTAALHLGYRLLGVMPGDEVWTSTLTFVATIAPAVQMGAVPRFLDVAPESWTLDPDLLERELTRAARRGRLPRAVVPVDLFGQCCDLPAILARCERWGVPVLCDSAAALGSTQHGRHAGRGALASEDPALIAAARHLASQAKEPAAHYQHETTGFTYALSSVLAAVGLAQLPALPGRVAARRAVFERYRAGLGDLCGLSLMPEARWGRSNRWLSVALFEARAGAPDRDAVRRALEAAGIESRPVWKPLHLQPAFRHAPRAGGAVAARLFEAGLCLPSGNGLTAAQQDRVVAAVRAAAGR